VALVRLWKDLIRKTGRAVRTVDGKQEMLLAEVVYAVEDYVPCSITKKRSIGHKAGSELRSIRQLGKFEYHEEDIWDDGTIRLITGLGMRAIPMESW
jgi:hypothetical protein